MFEDMTVDEIKSAVVSLSEAERKEIYTWLDELRDAAWDLQMEQDFAPGGRGQHLLEEVTAAIVAGHTRLLDDVLS